MNSTTIIIIVTVTFAMCASIIHFSSNDFEFSKLNPNWNGTSQFFSIPERHTTFELYQLSTLYSTTNSTLIIIAPNEEFTLDQIEYYRNYILRGNTIFLADDFGTGNSLLHGIGSNISILPGMVTSADRAFNNSYAIVSYSESSNHPIMLGVHTLVLDKAAHLLGGNPLATSSLFSWIDKNEDLKITNKEILGKYTILSYEKLGKGEIIVLSDPSIFINTMGTLENKWGNQKFIRNILYLNPTVYIDQIHSKTNDMSGLNRIIEIIKGNALLKIILMGIFLFFIVSLYSIKKLAGINEDSIQQNDSTNMLNTE